MNNETSGFTLRNRHDREMQPVLTAVQAHGRLDALLFELTLRQVYRNTGKRVLEVVYTFPLPMQATLVGFASELNGLRQEGHVVARPAAERSYEDALTEGDAPVLLEALGNGLYTANIGNLKPADEIVLEVRFAQLLTFEQGRLRLAIPTTIAPRFGNAVQSGLQPQQVPEADLLSDYPMTLSITIGATFSGAQIGCPTHPISFRPQPGGSLQIELSSQARLDRDVVITVTPEATQRSVVIETTDPADAAAPIVRLAALQVDAAEPRAAIDLRILVDCSGSMAGDSIASAQTAVREVLAALTPQDRVSFSRFGSQVVHELAPTEATAKTLRHQRKGIDRMQADLGGTEMENALAAIFNLTGSPRTGGADVLLLTDGEIWDAAPMIKAARKSAHRIFAIGVGTSPAESVLRNLAEATGGACEFATPGEALEAAARRMLHRMRQPAWRNVRIEWGSRPAWEIAPPTALFSGDTVTAFAGFTAGSADARVRLLADDTDGNPCELARCNTTSQVQSEVLPRVAAAERIRRADRNTETNEMVSLAVRYQIMCEHTACILVHQRADADKATDAAELYKVSSMLAAGWGGTAKIEVSALMMREPSIERAYSTLSCAYQALPSSFIDSGLSESQEGKLVSDIRSPGRIPDEATLDVIARWVVEILNRGSSLTLLGRVSDLDVEMKRNNLHQEVKQAIAQVEHAGLSSDESWVVLAWWINTRRSGLKDKTIEQTLKPVMDTINPDLLAQTLRIFRKWLGSFPVDSWEPGLWRRVRRVLAG